MAVVNLDDLADVYVPSPTDGYILYWDNASAKWRCEACPGLTSAQVAALIAAHAAVTTAIHGVGGSTIASVADIAVDANLSTNIKTLTITEVIDGGGSAIATGVKNFLEIPFACTILAATLLADQSGSIVVNVWKDIFANFPPTVADKITSTHPPTITTATNSQDTTLTGWTTAIAAGDILAFNVDSCTTITRVTLSLKVVKT